MLLWQTTNIICKLPTRSLHSGTKVTIYLRKIQYAWKIMGVKTHADCPTTMPRLVYNANDCASLRNARLYAVGGKIGNAHIRRFPVSIARGEGIPYGAMLGKKYSEALLRRFSQCLVGAIFRLDENGSKPRAPGKQLKIYIYISKQKNESSGFGRRFNVQS
jgi:hypothetical protein